MTARRIIAKGCIHLPTTTTSSSAPRPLAASVRVVRAPASPGPPVARPLADTSVKRWSNQDR